VAASKLKLTWWCEPDDFLPGFTRVRAEAYLEDGRLLSGSNLIPDSSERFILEMTIMELECAFGRYVTYSIDF